MIDLNPFTKSLGGNRLIRGLNPFNRGSIGQDAVVGALIDASPLPQQVKDAIYIGIGAKEFSSIPLIGKPLVMAGGLVLGEGAFRGTNPRSLREDLALANDTLSDNDLKRANSKGSDRQTQDDTQQMFPEQETPTQTGPQRLPVVPFQEDSEPQLAAELPSNNRGTDPATSESPRANDGTTPVSQPEQTKQELYDLARAKAVESGRQEDLDLVRDLGLSMHAERFSKLKGARTDLDLADQRKRAQEFLAMEIA